MEPFVECSACGELVPASDAEPVCGWLICFDCRTEACITTQAASGYDFTLDLPPFWPEYGDHRGKN